MNSWVEMIPLGELGKIVSGSTPRTNNDTFWGGDIPWITPADLTNHDGIYFKGRLRKITRAGYESCSTTMLPSGSILFSSRAPIGHCAITTYPLCTNQGFKSIVPNEKLDPVYGFFALKYFTPQIISRGRGATFAEINKEIFSSFRIPIPPLIEQKRIATILEKADILRCLRRYTRELSDSFLHSIFMDMFGDPVKNVNGYPWVQFGDVCDSRLGKMLDSKQQTGKFTRPYLRNVNIQWGKISLDDLQVMDFNSEDRKKYKLLPGDVLICEGGEVGRAAIWKNQLEECYFQKALHRVRADYSKITSEYIVWLMNSLAKLGGLVESTSQVTISHLTGVKLKAMYIPLPPISEQQHFANVVAKFEVSQAQLSEGERQVELLFKSILHRAFRGEL